MSTMLIANNCTRENGQFCGDQLCYLKAAYLFVQNAPPDVDRIVMAMSPGNEMAFLWEKFIEVHNVQVVYDDLNPGDNDGRWAMWDRWRASRKIGDTPFDIYKELFLRIHGAHRQHVLCGSERGLGRRNIYEYLWFGQEDRPDAPPRDWVSEWFNHGVATSYTYSGRTPDDHLIHHPARTHERDVYISPHAKTQGNQVFTFDFWAEVVHRLVDAEVTVTVGYDGYFCPELNGHPYFQRYWGDHRAWMEQICRHRLVACGNTGTGWLAAACGVPMITMEPPNSVMADHRYRECGLRNIVEVVSEPDPHYVAKQIVAQVKRRLVMTTGCYDVLHAGHVRHLERSRALGTRLVVALNSDVSIRGLKGPDRPINPQDERKAVLEALRCVDEVRLFDGPNALDLIDEIKPNVLTAGLGYKRDDVIGLRLIEGWGGRVVVTSDEDYNTQPSTTKVVQRVRAADIAEVCRAGQPYSVNPLDKLMLLAREFLSVRHLPGDVADLGACRGGTSLILHRLAPEKHLHVFDTWEGTPYDDPMCHHGKGSWAASYEDCKHLVGINNLTHYHKGVFPQNAEDDAVNNISNCCFVYVDMDTEQATHDAIMFFWPRLVIGGKLMFDDWMWEPCAGVEKAIRRVFSENQLVTAGNTCIVEKK